MRKNVVLFLAGVCLFSLLSGGCANKEVVKSEEAVVPQSQPVKQEVIQPTLAPVQQSQPTTQPAIVAAKPAQQQAVPVTTEKTSFETVYFDFDKADLRQDARSSLSRNADIITKTLSGAKVQIEGHCDERGSTEYNLALGERRAKSALQYLTTTGINADLLSIISYGKEKPAVQGSDEAAWAKNRRAEFIVIK
jgi:peptidoglycan-associated lipoprotein